MLKYKPYYKKVDRSALEWGITITKDYEQDFLAGKKLKSGTGRDIKIVWNKKEFIVKLQHINRKDYTNVYSLRWNTNKEFMKKLRKTFIQSYVIIKSKKEAFDIEKKDKKIFRTDLLGGQQEVFILTPLNSEKIKFEVFIKIDSGWNKLFQRLADENVFGWVFDKNNKYLIHRSTSWIDVKDFKKHKEAVNVIYYLVNTKKGLLYIGKAEILGKRVKPGKDHQYMPGNWDKFRYDIVKPDYSNILERIEDHTIRAFATILKNTKNYPSLELSNYKLANSNWKKL